MSIFGRRKDDALLAQLSRIADSLEQSRPSAMNDLTQTMIAQLNRIAEVIEQGSLENINGDNHELAQQLSEMMKTIESNFQGMNDDVKKAWLVQLDRIASALERAVPKEIELSDSVKKKAAYALNLCLVSVSQIIDYSDLYILEQEYDGILNNLNLEHMPKDEALLDVLRQILDTITFFRIQEGDKRFIEKKYQDEMKAAIWSAIPSCSTILACPDPTAMLVTLVTQVGTGYMNYRKTKSKISRDKEEAEWELHKAAIEQFNGLRRELFTTAWKLAEKYKFKDEWRLTESQITQYNQILREPNLNRRLVLLEDIESKFDAYPPFWYFKGHTALLLAEKKFETEIMSKIALDSFKKYFDINQEDCMLVRADPICAACALEYASLLNEGEEATKYITRAIESAGNRFDILQLCAMAFIDLGLLDRAAKALKHLVCEGYNETINAQLLSLIYVSNCTENGESFYSEYQLLCSLTDSQYILPWPDATLPTLDVQFAEFIATCKRRVLNAYANFISKYYTQKATECRLILATDECREKSLVMFIKKMEAELVSFPETKMGNHKEFVEVLKPHQEELKRLLTDGFNSKVFEDAFGDLFIMVANNVSLSDYSTMEKITQLELNLEKAVIGLEVARESCPVIENNTLRGLLEIEVERSEKFKAIHNVIKSRTSLLRDDAKHTQLLIAGEQDYYEYINRHALSERDVVAVINDRTVNDSDLIFMENGLLVHNGRSLATIGAKYVAFGVAELINEGLRFLLEQEVLYSNVEYTNEKIKNPKYKNKYVNMDELIAIINEIKQSTEGSIENRITTALHGIA